MRDRQLARIRLFDSLCIGTLKWEVVSEWTRSLKSNVELPMGAGVRKKDAQTQVPTAPPPPVAATPAPPEPIIYEASVGAPGTGTVFRVPPPTPITQAQAVALRKAGIDIVVCGPVTNANYAVARDIEEAAVGAGNWIRHRPHVNAGPSALPHCQPNPRPPAGHSFYETENRHAH